MPGNPQDLNDFTDVLKNVYLPVRRKAFPLAVPLLAAARRAGPSRVTYAGNDLIFDVKFGRRPGFVASAAGYFPHSKQAREKQGRLSVARTYALVQVDGLALKATQGNRASFIPAARKVVEDVTEQWGLEQNRILHGDSLAVRAVVDSVTSTTIVVADNPYGIAGAGPGNLHLEVGEDIAVLTSDGATLRGKTQISDISLSGDLATITYNAAVAGQSAGDIIVSSVPAAVDANDTSWGAEPHGIKSIIDVEGSFATFQGLKDDRWVAQKLTSTNIDEQVLMRLLNTIRNRSGRDWRMNPGNMLLVTTTGIWQRYGDSLLGLRRFDAPTMTLNGGFKAVEVGGAALLDDPWAPRGRLYAIHGPDTVFVDLMDFGKISFQDSPKWRLAQNRDAYEAVFASYWNYGVYMRSSHGVISGITDTVNYSPVY
jgi:hypothetical protein